MNGPYTLQRLQEIGGCWTNLCGGYTTEQSAIIAARAWSSNTCLRVLDSSGSIVLVLGR